MLDSVYDRRIEKCKLDMEKIKLLRLFRQGFLFIKVFIVTRMECKASLYIKLLSSIPRFRLTKMLRNATETNR